MNISLPDIPLSVWVTLWLLITTADFLFCILLAIDAINDRRVQHHRGINGHVSVVTRTDLIVSLIMLFVKAGFVVLGLAYVQRVPTRGSLLVVTLILPALGLLISSVVQRIARKQIMSPYLGLGKARPQRRRGDWKQQIQRHEEQEQNNP